MQEIAKKLREYAATEHGKRARLHHEISRMVFENPAALAAQMEALAPTTAFEALVSTYRIWRDKRGITHAERTSALQALSSVINELGWWKEVQDALIEKRR